ncbi:MAG: ATP-binding protein [Dehalococcoidia bacterium]
MRFGGFFRTLGFQIALAMSTLIVGVSALVVWQVDGLLRENESDRFTDEIVAARSQLEQQVGTDRELSTTGAAVLANQPDMRAAIDSGAVVTILQIGSDYYQRTSSPLPGTPGLQMYDAEGDLIVRAHDPLRGQQRVVPQEVRHVLDGGISLGVVRVDELLGPAIVGIAPVFSENGRIIGAIEVLTALDQSYLRERSRILSVELALLTEDGVVQAASDVSVQPGDITEADRQEAFLRGTVMLNLGGESYLSTILPLRSFDEDWIADIYIGIDESVILEGVSQIRWAAIRATGVGAVIALFLTIGLAFVAVRPISELVDAARRIQANDLDTPVQTSGPTEVLELADALDGLRLAVRQTREAMLSVNRELASKMDQSTASLTDATQELAVMHGVLGALSTDAPGGLGGVVEKLVELDWVEGALIALATEDGRLSAAAAAGLTPIAREALIAVIERGVRGQRLESGIVVADTSELPDNLRTYEVGGFAAQPMVEPDGVAGIVAVTTRRALRLTPSRTELLRSVSREVAAMLERTELAGEVEENRRIAEAVLREMSDGVLVIDHTNRCIVANPAAARLLGRERTALIGEEPETILPLGRDAIETLRRRAADPTRSPVAALLGETNGRRLAISAGPFIDSEAEPDRAGMMVLMRDLSAEAEAERVKQDFVSMVGHELRTPLTLIRTTIDLLNEGDAGALNETQRRIVEVLHANTDRLMALINDLLDMSALDSGRMQIQPEQIDIAAVVREAVEEAQPAAAAKEHRLAARTPEYLSVFADRKRVLQVLANLVGNAVKYTPPGGNIEVSVHIRDPWVEIRVTDSGIGIPPEEQAQLFEKFYRTTTGRRTTGGTGLGLAIARSLIDLHGGRIWVESDGRSGTTFAFTLPVRRI